MSRIFIRDGFTLYAEIPARGRRPALMFQYRPALPEAVYDYLQAPKATGKQRLDAVVGLLVAHVVGWDAIADDESQAPSAVTEPLLRRVPSQTLDAMLDIVTGYDEPTVTEKNSVPPPG